MEIRITEEYVAYDGTVFETEEECLEYEEKRCLKDYVVKFNNAMDILQEVCDNVDCSICPIKEMCAVFRGRGDYRAWVEYKVKEE